MAPVRDSDKQDARTGIFENTHPDFRAMQWPNSEYVLGTNRAHTNIRAKLPKGKWMIKRYDIISKREELLISDATGAFAFDAPNSRAVLFHFKKNQ